MVSKAAEQALWVFFKLKDVCVCVYVCVCVRVSECVSECVCVAHCKLLTQVEISTSGGLRLRWGHGVWRKQSELQLKAEHTAPSPEHHYLHTDASHKQLLDAEQTRHSGFAPTITQLLFRVLVESVLTHLCVSTLGGFWWCRSTLTAAKVTFYKYLLLSHLKCREVNRFPGI